MNWSTKKCVILAAGEGRRLSSFLEDKAKAMIEIRGKPLLAYVIDYWKEVADEFTFVVKYKKEQIIDYVKTLPIRSQFVEQEELKGIGHALRYIEPLITDNFILVLSDCICRGEFLFPGKTFCGIGVWPTNREEDIRRSYSVEIKNNYVVRVVEKPKSLPNDLCGVGFYFFDKRIFSYARRTPPSPLRNEIEITDVIQKMIDSGEKIVPVFFKGDYLNITYPEDLKTAEKILCE